MTESTTAQRIVSCVRADGRLQIALEEIEVGPPRPDEVVVRIEASPINPSDLGLLLAGADPATAVADPEAADSTLLDLPPGAVDALAARVGQRLPVGNEGAGTVVAAGAESEGLLGRTVACSGGGMWTTHRLIRAADCLPLPAGTPARVGAAAFVNPLTVLALLDTARRDGHTAVVHTAAASNLGQMLLRVCLADDIPLVCVVRSPEQVELLRAAGGRFVVDTSADDADDQLRDAITATAATVAFDAIGGGPLAGRLLQAMETAARGRAGRFGQYGSGVRTEVYVYGRLDSRPMTIDQATLGLAWRIRGWLLPDHRAELTPEEFAPMQRRVAEELTTTFASEYGQEVTLAELLDPEVLTAAARRSTGAKVLVTPS